MTEPVKPDDNRQVAPNSGFDFNQPTIISLCYLASFITGITGLVGIVLAHVWQNENQPAWAASHFDYLIRTFWFGFAGFVVAGVLSVVFIGILLMPLIAVWVGVRSVLSLLKAQRQEPMPDPKTLLF
ncbi:hypothetical protein MWU38_00275 [Qipengyuania sp. S6317L1]|uniref:DUF4870 family protein n=1 Tax=Qipengyuania sp. S6317L1 TaxID=2926410 RepID=UPI001FF4E719|nr:hypothetical protein [Qipengyuania sp. S6317L1]MCK0097805.1 hypothetical protein [Qipengyuania sp. S6317L1]